MIWFIAVAVPCLLFGSLHAHDPSCRTVEDCYRQNFHCHSGHIIVCSGDGRKRHEPRCTCKDLHLSSSTHETATATQSAIPSTHAVATSTHAATTLTHAAMTTTQEPSVNGGWSFWTEWSSCSASCDQGTQTRNRTCSNPAPKNDGLSCAGENSQIQICSLFPCAVDGYMSEWGSWGGCSATCGGGYQMRTRTCHDPIYGGKPCQGDTVEVNPSCNNQSCPDTSSSSTQPTMAPSTTSAAPAQNMPVDGYMGEWGSWSACSATCGGGYQMRTRTCHDPLFGGKNCTGEVVDLNPSCNTLSCPSQTTGMACPSCDDQLNCTWNQTCIVGSICMIRSYDGYPFTTHCIDATDCEIMKNSLPHCEVYCCTDKACLSKYLGV